MIVPKTTLLKLEVSSLEPCLLLVSRCCTRHFPFCAIRFVMSLPQSIIFFGDGSNETQTALSRTLLAQKKDSLLALFLSRVSFSLQEEYNKLSPLDRRGIPSFHDLDGLVRRNSDDRRPHPALHPTELVLVQLAHFIA